jgi:type IV secretory pathway VirB10-like protein
MKHLILPILVIMLVLVACAGSTQPQVSQGATQTPPEAAQATAPAASATSEPEEEEEATATREPTSTTELTETAEPTRTPEPPTETPEPTETVEPTETPEPELTETAEPTETPLQKATQVVVPTATPNSDAADEQAYELFVVEIFAEYGTALTTFGDLNTALGDDPLLFSDAEWLRQVSESSEQIQTTSNRILDYQPVPASYQSFHTRFRDAAQLMAEAMVGYRTALDNVDAPGLIAAAERIEEAAIIFEELASLAP